MADLTYYVNDYIQDGYYETIVVSDAITLSGAFSPSISVDIADDTGYFIPDYIATDYFAIPIQEADATLSVTATLAASVGLLQSAEVDISGAMSATLTASALKNHTAILDTTASLTVTAEVTRTTSANINSSATMTVAAGNTQLGEADLSVSASQASTANRTASGVATFSGAFAPSITVKATRTTDIDLDVTAALSTDVNLRASAEVTLSHIVNLSLQGDRVRFFDASQSVTASLSSNGNSTLTTTASQSAAFALTATISHIEGADITLSPFASLTADIGVIKQFTGTISTAVSLSATLGQNVTGNSSLVINSECNAYQFRYQDPNLMFESSGDVTFTSTGVTLGQNGTITSTTATSDEAWYAVPYFGINPYGTAPYSNYENYVNTQITIRFELQQSSVSQSPGTIIQGGLNTSSGQHHWKISLNRNGADNGSVLTFYVEATGGSSDITLTWSIDDTDVDFTDMNTFVLTSSISDSFTSGFRYQRLRVQDASQSTLYNGSLQRFDSNLTNWTSQSDPRFRIQNLNANDITFGKVEVTRSGIGSAGYYGDIENLSALKKIDLDFGNDGLYNDVDNYQQYFVLTQIASANLSTTATLTTTPSILFEGAATLSGIFAPTITVKASKSGEINLDVSSSLTANIGVRKLFEIDLSSNFSANVDAAKLVEAGSNLSVAATQTTTAVKTVTVESNFAAIASNLVAVNKIGNTIIDESVTSTLTATPVKTATVLCALSVLASQTASGIIEISGAATLSSTASVSCDGSRVRFGEANPDAQFTQNTVSNFTTNADADLDVAATVSATATGFVGIDAQLTSAFSVSATISKITGFDAALAVSTVATATGDRIASAEIDIDAVVTQSITPSRIRDFDSDFDAIASNITVAFKIADFFINIEPRFTLATQPVITAVAESDINTAVTQNVTAGKLHSTAQSSLSAQSSLTADSEVVFVTDANLLTEFTQTANANFSVVSGANLTVTTTTSFDVDFIAAGAALVVSSGTLTAGVNIITDANSTLNAVATVNADNERIRSFDVAITGAFAPTVAIRSLRLDNIVYVIPGEGRSYTVPGETREYTIDGETREYTIT